jgi:DNA adenine methylase
MATDPRQILEAAYRRAEEHLNSAIIADAEVAGRIKYLATLASNRAGVRFIMSCALAKAYRPGVDIRKPYTEIGDPDAYSGRATYDEIYVAELVEKYKLPVNHTTAWLTPAFRNIDKTLTTDVTLVGTPKKMYVEVIKLLDDVHQGKVSAEDVLAEMLRDLLIIKEERRKRMESLQASLASVKGDTGLSVEGIVTLIEQHLRLPHSARLPVLIVAAAYKSAEDCLGESMVPLESHNAADKQTGSIGDLEVTLKDESNIVTSFEMKKRKVTTLDIDYAVAKVAESGMVIDNYIFITTEPIEPEVAEYAKSIYGKTGVEFAILDCLSFLRYFLYLFYRLRMVYLEAYQELVLAEPESAVSQPLKEAFLAMRQAAESAE